MSKLKKIECEFFHLKFTTKKVGQATSASYWSYEWKTRESFEEYVESFKTLKPCSILLWQKPNDRQNLQENSTQ